MATTALYKVPTAMEVDRLAIEYDEGKRRLLDATLARVAAQEALEPMEERLIELVSRCGSPHAQKSKLLHGLKWEIMGTFGTSTSVDSAAVERLRLELTANKKTRLVKRLFEATVRWTLRSTARAEILKPDVPNFARSLYVACEVTRDRSPVLTVREK